MVKGYCRLCGDDVEKEVHEPYKGTDGKTYGTCDKHLEKTKAFTLRKRPSNRMLGHHKRGHK